MNLMKTTHAFAAIAFATLGFAFPAEASIAVFFSSTNDCLGANAASFSPGGAVVPMSLCVTANPERTCGVTYNLQSASAGQNNAFLITTRAVGPAVNDGTADAYFDVVDPVSGLSVVPQGITLVRPDGSGVPQPIAITNPPSTVDLGSTTNQNAGVVGSASPRLLGTVTLAPQSSATQASYVISLSPNASFGSTNTTCGSSLGNPITASFTLTLSLAPAITSAATTTFTVATAGAFNVTAAGTPAPTFSATGTFPGGVSLTAAGLLSGTPASGSAGNYPLTVTATNGNAPNGTQSFSLVIAKRAQNIMFGAIAAQPFNASSFTITGASASSGLAPTFTSSSAGVCTVSTAVVTFLTSGTCTITADQAGNIDFSQAAPVTQSFAISGNAPSAPTVTTGTPGNNSATLAFTAPVNNGGIAILDYTATCTGAPTASITGAASPLSVTGLTNGNAYACTVVARNAVGTGPASGVVTVVPSAVPVPPAFTSAANANFAFGVLGTFNVTATGSPPPSFSTAGPLPGGVTLTAAGVLSGIPGAAGTFSFAITATGGGTATTQAFTLTISKADQAITFNAVGAQLFNASPIALNATATSTLPVTFSSATPGSCAVAGASVTFLSAGTCTIVASQVGNANYNAAPPATQSFVVNASAPGAPTIGGTSTTNQQAFIGFTPPSVTGGSAILDYRVTCTGGAGSTATGTTSPLTLTGLVSGTTYTCSVTARNAVGSGPPSATVSVTPAPIVPPNPPTITAASAGNSQAIISFTPPTLNGGSAITGYTATCNPGGITATAVASPITVIGLANNTTYTCSVTANNSAGPSLPLSTVTVTPTNVPITLGSTATVAAYGAEVTLMASVTGNGQTGTVAFIVITNDGPVALPGCRAVKLIAGTASCTSPGAYQNQNPRQYLATYSGDANNPLAGASLSQVVAVNSAVLTVAAYPLPPIVTGRTTTLTALVKMNSPVGTVTFSDNGVPITGCTQAAIAMLPDATDSAVATCTVTAPTATSGVRQYVATYFYPTGHVSGRVSEQANFDLRVVAQGPVDYTDMWWAGGTENGWGMSVAQHGPIQFNVIFAYDNLGKSLWYVMPGGSFNAAGTVFTGPLFLATSSPFSAYDKTKFVIGAPVGTATITYTSSSNAILAYTINGISATKSIQRQIFSLETTGPNLRTNDLWWATFAEDGWGMNIAQQGRVLFPVWYTYDATGKATFFTAQGGSWNGTVWSGIVFMHASSAWLGVPYNPALFTATNVGTISLDFSDASNATMTTTVNGITQVRHIERQPY